jgi:two-component system, NtrC family, response regulator AtoC
MRTSILIVDDDPDYADILKDKLQTSGFRDVDLEFESPIAAERLTHGAEYDVMLIDMHMPEMDGFELLDVVKTVSPRTECIMVTAVNEARVAVECLRKGAYDYLVKPVTTEDLIFALKRTLEHKRLLDVLDIEKGKRLPELKNNQPFKPIVTRSSKMLRVMKEAELHAGSDVPVLITGDSGTGKELLARAIHEASPRAGQPFTPVNMASLTPGLFEAEFFGHTKGAFTGAENERSGYLKASNHGTVFLDEIGNLPLELQGKLLRVLQDGEYSRLGTSRRQKVDVRYIAATNADLERLMAQKRFRPDLYYRIRGGWLHLPPLKERSEDIPLLADAFIKKYLPGRDQSHIDEETMCLLMAHDYPGNVRELQSIIQTAANLAQGELITTQCIPRQLRKRNLVLECIRQNRSAPLLTLAEVEKNHIVQTYEKTGHNKSRTARLLEIGLNTLRRKLRVYGVK